MFYSETEGRNGKKSFSRRVNYEIRSTELLTLSHYNCLKNCIKIYKFTLGLRYLIGRISAKLWCIKIT